MYLSPHSGPITKTVTDHFVYGLLQSSKQLLSIRVQTRLYIRPLVRMFPMPDSEALKRMSALTESGRFVRRKHAETEVRLRP
jgi:hypothetical protein